MEKQLVDLVSDPSFYLWTLRNKKCYSIIPDEDEMETKILLLKFKLETKVPYLGLTALRNLKRIIYVTFHKIPR